MRKLIFANGKDVVKRYVGDKMVWTKSGGDIYSAILTVYSDEVTTDKVSLLFIHNDDYKMDFDKVEKIIIVKSGIVINKSDISMLFYLTAYGMVQFNKTLRELGLQERLRKGDSLEFHFSEPLEKLPPKPETPKEPETPKDFVFTLITSTRENERYLYFKEDVSVLRNKKITSMKVGVNRQNVDPNEIVRIDYSDDGIALNKTVGQLGLGTLGSGTSIYITVE